MLKILKSIVTSVLLTQPVRGYDVVPTDAMCAGMLAEIKACLSGERTVEQLLNEWKWGDIKTAFAFNSYITPEKEIVVGTVFGVCPSEKVMVGLTFPFSFETGRPPFPNDLEPQLNDLNNGHWPHVSDLEKCYWAFGIERNLISVRQKSLMFVYCSKRSPFYFLALRHLGLQEPQYEEVQTKQSVLCWDTAVHGKTRFEPSGVDVQVVPWGTLNDEVDVAYLFNQRKCVGIMLLNRKNIPAKSDPEIASPDTATRDFSKLNGNFLWMPDRKAEGFEKEIAAHNIPDRRKENLSYILNRARTKHADNGEYLKLLGFRFLGSFTHPAELHLDAPWYVYCYYESPGRDMVLTSLEWNPNWVEKFLSFVMDVKKLPEEARILLPHGLDIKPYLYTPPSSGVLYEHVRTDKRARIVVQPHIAYLYEDDRLSKILVCNDENGPPDHGWSLVREFYVCAWTGYFWPVTRAYSPLEQ